MKTITSFLSKIDKLISKQQINLDHYEIFYRGENACHKKTMPSVFRNDYLKNEHKIFRELELRYPSIFDNTKTTIDKLSIMQHYGLPTRLLDFTTNPLLALYMAVEAEDYTHFCPTIKIVAVKKEKIKYYDSDTVSVFANFAKIDNSFEVNLDSHYYNDNGQIGRQNTWRSIGKLGYYDLACRRSGALRNGQKDELASLIVQDNYDLSRLLHEIRAEKPYFQANIWAEHLNESVVFVKPKHNSQRIINQAGLFALFGINNGKESFALEDCTSNEHFKLDSFKLCDCIKKPKMCDKDFVSEVKQQLATLGITADKVYPEIEYSSTYIKNMFLA